MVDDTFAKGLEGVIAAESSICFIDGEAGTLLYRGYNIHDLAEHSSFEEITYLLLFGKLPTKAELKEFSKQLAEQRTLPKELLKLMRGFGPTADPMDALRTSVSLLADFDGSLKDLSPQKNIARAISLTAKFPTIVAAAHHLKNNRKPIKPKKKLSHAGNFLYMLTGEEPDAVKTEALDTDFILHAEHGFNASTFSARVTISTLSDLYAATVAAIGTLKGPLHGGAAGEVFAMLKAINSADRVESYVQDAIANKRKFMGFGHRVYKTTDPRAVHLKAMSKKLAEDTKNFQYFNISDKLESVVVPLLKEKRIYPNVDFYSPTVYHNLGIPEELYNSIFAISRISGWSAHVLEQLADNRIIRPREKYTGGMNLPYVLIGKRK